jgi:glycosidase
LQPGWWNDAVFYEIFVRSFKDSSGDGIGDFNGITEKLDYLNDGNPNTTTDLGVTALWLMPIMASGSYHGYDVNNYYTVNPQYGSKLDFLRLVDEAHKRGIRIIIDLVLNHTGLDNSWFRLSDRGDPKYRDWYIWSKTKPSYTGPWGEQVWYAGKDGYYYAVFWSGMPDLNLANPVVTKEVDNFVSFWLNSMNVDGFRLDAIPYFLEDNGVLANSKGTHAWLQAFYQYNKSIDPSIYTVGEAWMRTDVASAYVSNHEVDNVFEFDLASAFLRSAAGPLATSASDQLKTVLANYPAGQYGVFLTNHDQPRTMTVLRGDVKKAKLAAVMMLTSPGVPYIYYGEEIGMTGAKPDENLRRPMQWTGNGPTAGFTSGTPWEPVANDYRTANVAVESADPNSLLSLYRRLIHLRNQYPALRTGQTIVLNSGSPLVYAILRYDEKDAFLILLNVDDSRKVKADSYGIKTDSWPIPANFKISSVMGLQNPAKPQMNAAGGLEDYRPYPTLPPQSYTILHFAP